MPDFTIIETTVSDKIDAMQPLFEMHHDELAKTGRQWKAAPHKAAYQALEESGSLLVLIAYQGDEIVGYSINFIGLHLHYSGLRYAHNDALFVRPELRGSGLGIKLIHETERRASERGANMLMWHAKPETMLASLLPRMGYGMEEIQYCKEF